MSEERRFSEKQVRQIMSRAIEMQQSQLMPADDGTVPEADLESMARELSVPIENVHEAIRELETGHPLEQRSAALGEVTVERVTRTVPVTLSREYLQELAAALPSVLGESGQSSVVGSSISYATSELEAMQSGSRSQIAIHAGARQTIITISEDMRTMAGGIFGGIVGGMGGGVGFGVGFGVGLGALGSPLFAAIFPFLSLGGAFLAARALYRRIVRSKRTRTQERVARIRSYIAENGTKPTDDEDTPRPQ